MFKQLFFTAKYFDNPAFVSGGDATRVTPTEAFKRIKEEFFEEELALLLYAAKY